MTWHYEQINGELSCDGEFEGTGYSGTREGRNNPDEEGTPNVGPIPRGSYIIEPAIDKLGTLGPCVMALQPTAETDTLGRGGFFIHGNNRDNDASHGCIILGPAIRKKIAASADRKLVVV